MGVNVKSDALLELVDEGASVEQVATGFTFTEGPIWNHAESFLLFSDMPGDVRRKWSEAEGVVEVMRPSNKCNGMTYEAAGTLLVCEHRTSSLMREHPDGTRETVASHFEGKELNSPNDVTVRSDGTIYFSDPWYGRMPVFGFERERELGLPGRLQDRARRRRPRARRRPGRVRAAERALLLARRVAHVHQRHAGRLHQGLRRERRRHARERAHVLRRRRLRRHRGGHPRRDEVRRARQHLGDGPRRHLGDQRGRRAPRDDRGAREHRQPHLGRRRLAHRSSSRARPPCTRSAPRSARGASRTWPEKETRWATTRSSRSTRAAPLWSSRTCRTT